MVEPKISGQPGQNQVKWSRPCLAGNVFVKGFFSFGLKVCLKKIPLGLFW